MHKSILGLLAVAVTTASTMAFVAAPVKADGAPCPTYSINVEYTPSSYTRDGGPTNLNYQALLDLCLTSSAQSNLAYVSIFEGEEKLGTIFRHNMPNSRFVWTFGEKTDFTPASELKLVSYYQYANGNSSVVEFVYPQAVVAPEFVVNANIFVHNQRVMQNGQRYRVDFYGLANYNLNGELIRSTFSPLTWVKSNGSFVVLNDTTRAAALSNGSTGVSTQLTNNVRMPSNVSGDYRTDMYSSARLHNFAVTRNAKGSNLRDGGNWDLFFPVVQTFERVVPAK